MPRSRAITPPRRSRSAALLSYLHETQKSDLSYISDLEYYEQGRFMELDLSARRNLELTETIRGKEKRGSLLWVLDKTKTAMGARCLRAWLDASPARRRCHHSAARTPSSALVNDTMAREELILALSGISDMERLIGRIVYGTAGGRDLVVAAQLHRAASPAVRKPSSRRFTTGRLQRAYDSELDPLTDIGAAHPPTRIVDEPPFSVREGGFIRKGYNAEVDRLHEILSGGKGLLAAIETREKEKHRHPHAEDRLQQGLRLLYRGLEFVQGPGPRHLHPQADARQRRALHHRRSSRTWSRRF